MNVLSAWVLDLMVPLCVSAFFLWLFWKQNDFLTLQTLAHLEEK